MKLWVVFLLILGMTVPQMAEAQDERPLPFTKRPVSQEEYARAIEADDQTVLNVRCEMIVTAANQSFETENLIFKDCTDLAKYVRSLSRNPCPQVKANLGRVFPNGTVDLRGYSRNFREGEQCLYDGGRGLWFASLSCGNIIPDGDEIRVFTAMREERINTPTGASTIETERQTQTTEKVEGSVREDVVIPATRNQLTQPSSLSLPLSATESGQSGHQKNLPRSAWSRHKKWILPVLAGGVVGAAACAQWCRGVQVTQTVTIN